MLLGIDHLVIACADPDAAAADLERELGVRAGGGGRHEALGTFNRLVWFGDTYLELIGVFDRDLAAGSWVGGPTVRVLDAGGGLATWAIATDDIEGDVRRFNEGGAGLTEPIDGERVRPDGEVVRWRLAMPHDLGPERPPFLIEHDASGAEWSPADRAARAKEIHPLGGPVRLTTLELPITDMPGTIATLMRTVRVGPFRPSLAGGGTRDSIVGAQTLRLRPERGGRESEGSSAPATWTVASIHLIVGAATQPRTVDILGCRFVLRSA